MLSKALISGSQINSKTCVFLNILHLCEWKCFNQEKRYEVINIL